MNTGSLDIMGFMPIVVIFVIFYFLILRPQQKKAKEHMQTLSALRRGDRVATTGGIIGIISKIVNDQEIQLEVAENVKVRLLRASITDVLSKTEPVATEVAASETTEEKSDKKPAAPKKPKTAASSKTKSK
jgi:preprotein translocase subunit YajC